MKIYSIKTALVVALGILAVTFAIKYAGSSDWISPEWSERGIGILMGLVVVIYSSAAAKQGVSLSQKGTGPAWRQSCQRRASTALTLGGLGYALIWMFAPLTHASPWDMVPILLAFGYIAVLFIFRPGNKIQPG